MRIAVPISSRDGLNSMVNAHFTSADAFLIFDDLTGEWHIEECGHSDPMLGAQSRVQALGKNKVGMVIVGGIGMTLIQKLRGSGMRVFQGTHGTVEENIHLFRDNFLKEIGLFDPCTGMGRTPDQDRAK